jgi:hypothetical protein
MPISTESPAEDQPEADSGQIAVWAEVLYLINLLVIPGLGFALLYWLYRRHIDQAAPLDRAHLQQTLSGSIWAGVLLVLVNLLILLLGGYQGVNTWVILITYFTLCHASLVLFGAYGLAKAMSGLCWRYPLVGKPLPEGCPQKQVSL